MPKGHVIQKSNVQRALRAAIFQESRTKPPLVLQLKQAEQPCVFKRDDLISGGSEQNNVQLLLERGIGGCFCKSSMSSAVSLHAPVLWKKRKKVFTQTECITYTPTNLYNTLHDSHI